MSPAEKYWTTCGTRGVTKTYVLFKMRVCGCVGLVGVCVYVCVCGSCLCSYFPQLPPSQQTQSFRGSFPKSWTRGAPSIYVLGRPWVRWTMLCACRTRCWNCRDGRCHLQAWPLLFRSIEINCVICVCVTCRNKKNETILARHFTSLAQRDHDNIPASWGCSTSQIVSFSGARCATPHFHLQIRENHKTCFLLIWFAV